MLTPISKTVVQGVPYSNMRSVLVFAALLAAVAALPTEIPEPGQLALVLGEDDFEDYLDAWLEHEQSRSANSSNAEAELRSGNYCLFT